MLKAHRLSWKFAFGTIPHGLCVLHRCDNPRCVRPDHLFLGTDQDNKDDMNQKRRNVFHKNNPSKKLTDAQVRLIRRKRARGVLLRVLAAEFAIAESMVCRIARGVRRGAVT